MRRNFDLSTLRHKLKPTLALKPGMGKAPHVRVRAVLGTLLAANLIAAFLVLRPWGGSAEELEARLADLRRQAAAQRVTLERVRALSAKIDKGRKEGDGFITKYFFDRRTAYSTLLEELARAVKATGLKPRDHSFSIEPVEGSDTIGMLTVTANSEGSYADLLKLVNLLDKSSHFLILESLAASPQQSGGVLNISIKLNTFVQESGLQVAAAQTGAMP